MYKPTDVFLNADDCDKIAPYIPKEMLKGWEWWWRGDILINISKTPLEYTKTPALDVGILGEILTRHSDIVEFDCISAGIIIQPRTVGNSYQYFDKESELQNRRDALMYLIDKKLISPVEGREK